MIEFKKKVGKMAALCTGISYGLSQSCLSNQNKELIFVKLTDSAYRAIEEYQKNQVSNNLIFKIFLSINLQKTNFLSSMNSVKTNEIYLISMLIYFNLSPLIK